MIKDYWLEDKLVVTRYWGEVTGGQLHQASLVKSGDERLDGIKYIIGDWLGASTNGMGPADIVELVAYLEPISRLCPRAKSGTIVRPDKTGNALAQYYKMLCEEQLRWEVEVFNDYESCFEWFGIRQQPIPYMNETLVK